MRLLPALVLFTATAASAAEWSTWQDRDNPSGSGDWEWVANMWTEGRIACPSPIAIEARRISDGVDALATGENVHLSLAGFRCIRGEQANNSCADYEARVLCPSAADGAWSAWINRDSPNGSGDYERANTDAAGGRIDCTAPIAIQTRRVSDQLDMTRTGEVYSFWPASNKYGFTCYNANQPDNVCDDYESRYFCPSETYVPPIGIPNPGVIDMGDFTVHYTAADLYESGGEYFVATGFEIWFGDVYLDFDDAMLQLAVVDGAFELSGAIVSAMPSSNIPVFDVLDLMPGGLDITLGYGSGDILADIEAPLNPNYKFLFLDIGVGSAQFGNIDVDAPGAVSAIIAIAPDPVTVYANLAGFFPSAGPITLDEVGVGFSMADGLQWTPVATWGYPNDMVAQTGNTWLNATIAYGVNDVLSVNFTGEVLADVDFDAVANGEDGLETLAFNGLVDMTAGVSVFSISQEIANMSVLYLAETNRWIAICESADLANGLIGPAAWLQLSATAKIAVEFVDDAFVSMTISGDVGVSDPFGTDYTIGNATVEATPDGATLSGALDLFVATVAVTGSFYDGGFSFGGETTAILMSGFYEVRARASVDPGGVGVTLGVRAWDFGLGGYGDWIEVAASYDANNGWCAGISALTVCLGAGGLALSGEVGDEIEAALSEGWSIASGAVVDAANDVVEDAAEIVDWLVNGGCNDHSECGANEWCDAVGFCQPEWSNGHACLSDVECQSGHCVGTFCRECGSHGHCGNNEWCDASGVCQPEWSNGHACVTDVECQSGHCVNLFCRECASHGHCGNNEWCDAAGFCQPESNNGHACASNIECQSGHCVGLVCRECASHSHCGNNEWCDAGGVCQPEWNNGHACLSNIECQSGWCDVVTCRAKRSNGSGCTANIQCASNNCGWHCPSIWDCGFQCK